MKSLRILTISITCCLTITAASVAETAAKRPDQTAGWWAKPATQPAAQKTPVKRAAPRSVLPATQEAKDKGPAIEPLRWPGREAPQRETSKWVIEVGTR